MHKVVRLTLAASAVVCVTAAGFAAPAFASGGHDDHHAVRDDHGARHDRGGRDDHGARDDHGRHGRHAEAEHHAKSRLLIHDSLVGSLTSDQPIFGVAPGGVDWTASRSTATVTTTGRADVHVRKLLVTATQANPVTTISASLFCNGMRADTLGPVAFDAAGNARIRGTFTVPDRCLAPTLMLNPADRVGTFIGISGQAG
jgi:hypothetical protein